MLVATLAAGCGGGAEEPVPMTEEELIPAKPSHCPSWKGRRSTAFTNYWMLSETHSRG